MADKLREAIALIRNLTADCQWTARDINPFSGRSPAPEIATILNAVAGGHLLLHQEGWAISPVIVGRFHDDTWLSDCFEIDAPDQRPTHWMPLPEAPQ